MGPEEIEAGEPPAPEPRSRRLWRVAVGAGLVVALLAVVLGGVAYALLRTVDLAGFAAARASAVMGRPISIERVRVVPGRWMAVEVLGVGIPNIPGASPEPMATLRRAYAEIDVLSLVHGPLRTRNVVVEGVSVLLERTADRTPNWRTARSGAKDPQQERRRFPSVRSVRAEDVDVVYRTTSGRRLVTHVDHAAIDAAADDQPVHLTAAGAYNATPVSLDADLGTLEAYRDADVPFPTVVHLASGEVVMTFDGAMDVPLDVDGMKGTLTLDAEQPGPIFEMAGVKSSIDSALHLTGDFTRRGDTWTLADAFGALNDDSVMSATLRLAEGGGGRPDDVTVDVTFDRLDLNPLLGAGARGKRSGADMPLAGDTMSGTVLHVAVAAREVTYGDVVLSDAAIKGSLGEGKVEVDSLVLTIFGIHLKATGGVIPAGSQGRVTAEVAATGADTQALRRRFGLGAVPLMGRLDGQFVIQSSGAGLNEAIRAARISGIIALRGGSIAKEVIEMASTDVRALFRTNRGMTPVSCLLAGMDIRAGVGTLAPLRVRAAEGTIAGSARFDLNRKVLDLTIGSEARTTGLFALDIPIRVSGSFASPDVRPATWTPQGRALLAAADDLSQLPPSLQAMARRNPCPPAR